MAGERREVVVYFRGVERDLTRSADASRRSLTSVATTAAKVGVGIAAGFAARKVVSEIGKSIRAQSDMRESVNKTNVIFGTSSKAVQGWSQQSVFSLGLTRQEALASASAFGDMFLQLGIGRPKAVGMSESMVKLAADFASFHNADISDVLLAQQSAFRGEYDALQRFVPGINAARVEQEALRLTHKGAAADLTQAEKAQAAYNIMLRDGKRASGDFANTAAELANGQRIAKAAIGQTRAELGQAFLPAARRLVNYFNHNVAPEMLRFARAHAPAMGRSLDQLAQKFLANLPPIGKLGTNLAGLRGRLRITALGFRAFWQALHGEGITTESGTFVGTMERIGVAARALPPMLRSAWQSFREGRGEAHSLVPTLKVAGAAMGFVADHADLIAKHMPLIIGAIAAYRGAQALANVADSARVVLLPLQIAATFALARANRSLAASNRSMGASSIEAAGAEKVQSASTNLAAGSAVRERIATVASAVAKRAAMVATRAYAAGQWLLNAALTANPIGIVIAVLAALAVGIVVAYRRSETFRRIVQGAWKGIQGAASGAWSIVRRILANLMSAFITVAGSIVRSAATAFGWVPGVGPKLRAAAAKFEDFRRSAQGSIDKLRGKTVKVGAEASFGWGNLKTFRSPGGRLMFARGGLFRGQGTTTSDSNPAPWISDREFIVNAESTARHRELLEAINNDRVGAGRGPGFALGGIYARGATSGLPRLYSGVDKTAEYSARLADRMGRAQLAFMEARYAAARKEYMGGLGNLGGGMGWQWQMRVLRAVFPGLQLISGFRPGAITATGNRSYHASGRAVDVPPRMDVFNWIRATYGARTRELIFSPAGSRQVWNGHPHVYTGITRANHWTHVHWAMRNGGTLRVNRPMALMDLSTGRNVAFMGESGPERLSVTPVSPAARADTSGAAAGGTILVDLSVTLDGQVLERRLERVRARRRAGDPTGWGR